MTNHILSNINGTKFLNFPYFESTGKESIFEGQNRDLLNLSNETGEKQ